MDLNEGDNFKQLKKETIKRKMNKRRSKMQEMMI